MQLKTKTDDHKWSFKENVFVLSQLNSDKRILFALFIAWAEVKRCATPSHGRGQRFRVGEVGNVGQIRVSSASFLTYLIDVLRSRSRRSQVLRL